MNVGKFLRTPFLNKTSGQLLLMFNDMKYKLRSEFMNNNLRNYTFSRAAVFQKMTSLKCPVFVRSCLEVFYKKAVPKMFAKFTGKHPKKCLHYRCFLLKLTAVFWNSYSVEHLRETAFLFYM